jgi:hypothetical protein
MSFAKYLKLREVSEEDLKKINPNRDLHFNNIFGNKLRVVVPLEQDENINKLISKIEELGYEVDYEDLINKKQAYKKIKTQQGEKLRPEKVGKILQSNNQRELLDWWQKNGENLKNNEVGASIVISRSPIDVLRMSDHDGISSCHSPDGQFYKCARQEARTGGAVAYVVKNSDLKKVNLQDKEIFKDYDRDVEGIVPLERLRLRRLTNGEIDLLMPELRTYGIKNVGFLSAVKNWAKNAQHSLISKIDPVEGYKSFKLKGGSYQDNDTGKVWSGFFDVSVSGSKRSQDEDEENEDETGDVLERAERALQDHRQNWKHTDVYLDESEGYLHYSASGGFSISKKLFTVEIGDWKDNNYKIVKRIVEDALDINGLQDIEITQHKDSYFFSFSFEERDGYGDELNMFEHFLDYVDEVDRDFEEHVNRVHKALLEEGYIKDLSEKIEFKNFYVELDDEDFTVSTNEPEKIGYLKDYSISKNNVSTYDKIKIRQWNEEFPNLINQYRILPFKVTKSNFDLFLDPNSTSGAYSDSKESSYRDSNLPENTTKLTGWVYFNMTISLTIDLYKNSEVIKRLKNLDNNWDFYIKKLAKLFDIFIRNKQSYSQDSLGTPIEKLPDEQGSRLLSMGRMTLDKDLRNNQKQLAQKPIFKRPQKQLGLNFKEWLENLAYEKAFAQRDVTQKTNVGKLLGFPKNLNIINQGSFATLYQHPKHKDRIIKITSHKEDVYNLVKAQQLNSNNVAKVYDWDNKQKIKEIPHLSSFAIIVENIVGSPMVYTTNDFYELTLGGKFNLASDWILQGGNPKQKLIMEKYDKNNDQEHNKLFELFRTLYQLRKFYKIDLSDFEDNIIDAKDRYVLVDMGF